jgi:hypothetical protein
MHAEIAPDETARRFREYVRDHSELVYDEYQPECDRSLNGACYVLAESYFHAAGGTESGLDIYCLSWSDVGVGGEGTHWFLRRQQSGTVVDLGLDTSEQAARIRFSEATRRAFITGYQPSAWCKRVLDALTLAH